VYRQFFDHYLLDTENKYRAAYTAMKDSPYLLDGHMAGRMKQMLTDLNRGYGLPEFRGTSWMTAGELRSPRPLKWESRHEDFLGQIRKQIANVEAVINDAEALHEKMTGHPSYFFDVNIRPPAKMFRGLMRCTAETMLATKAESQGNREASLTHLREALHTIQEANTVKRAMLNGQWAG